MLDRSMTLAMVWFLSKACFDGWADANAFVV